VALLALGISSAQKDKNATSAEVNATTAEEEDDSSESSDDADDEDDDADQQTPKEQEIAAQAEAEALVLQAKAQDAEKRARDKARMSREARELRRQKIFDAEEKLQANLHEQEEIDARLIDLHNTGAFERRIDRNVRVVANETQAKGLAEMLGSMYKEMWKFGAPALSDELEERAHELKYREPSLQALLADAKKRPGDHKDKPVEKPVVEQATLAPNRVKTEAVSSSNIPKFTAATMPAVSPAMRCVMLLTAQFFIISTLAQIASTMDDYARDDRFNTLQQMSEAAIKTVAYAPMLAVLFAATRVRAIQLSQGDTEKHQLPQPWVQTMMYCCTAGVLGQLVMVIILPIFTGTFEVRTTPDGRIETIPQNLKPIPAKILAILRYVLLALLYGGIGAVCVGLCIMEGPPATRHLPVSPAVRCTIILTVTYFLVFLLSALLSTYVEFRRASEFVLKIQRSFDPAQSCVSFAPMIAVLFIGARVRALQIDPANGNPQAWAQRWFFACTFAVVFQTLLTIAMPHLDPKARFKIESDTGMVEFEFSNPTLQTAVTVVWYVILFVLYTGICAVVISVFLIQHPEGPAKTPEVAPALHCAIELSFWYFLVQTALFVVVTIQSFLPQKRKKVILDKLIDIFQGAVSCLAIAPMLAILFLSLRIRSNQLTMATDGSIPPTAGPQLWAQSMMFLVTWAAILQALSVCLKTYLLGKSTEDNSEGKGSKPLVAAFTVLNYICLACMYGGACTIVYAMFTMTPENLPPYAAQGLPGGVVVPKPVSPGHTITEATALF